MGVRHKCHEPAPALLTLPRAHALLPPNTPRTGHSLARNLYSKPYHPALSCDMLAIKGLDDVLSITFTCPTSHTTPTSALQPSAFSPSASCLAAPRCHPSLPAAAVPAPTPAPPAIATATARPGLQNGCGCSNQGQATPLLRVWGQQGFACLDLVHLIYAPCFPRTHPQTCSLPPTL